MFKEVFLNPDWKRYSFLVEHWWRLSDACVLTGLHTCAPRSLKGPGVKRLDSPAAATSLTPTGARTQSCSTHVSSEWVNTHSKKNLLNKMNIYYYVSFLLLIPEKIKLRRENVYFGCLWSHQSVVDWPHCSGTVARQHITGENVWWSVQVTCGNQEAKDIKRRTEEENRGSPETDWPLHFNENNCNVWWIINKYSF